MSNLDTSIDETDSGGYAFGYSDVPLDGPGRFQIDWGGYSVGYDRRFQGQGHLPDTQSIGNPGENECRRQHLS